ncbi:MAG: GNAT family N-acetyltransferase [Bacillota bacterium]
MVVRLLQERDFPRFIGLMDEYMVELFGKHTTLSREACLSDGFGRCFDAVVAERNGRLIGFGVWQGAYDIHWGIKGGNVMDLYVEPQYRGSGIALEMLVAIANQVQHSDGVFLSGMAVDDERVSRLYKRIAMGFKGEECIVGGRAFREFASLHGRPAREMFRLLPTKEANYEP